VESHLALLVSQIDSPHCGRMVKDSAVIETSQRGARESEKRDPGVGAAPQTR